MCTDKLFRAAPSLESFWPFLTKHGIAAMSGSVIKENDFPPELKGRTHSGQHSAALQTLLTMAASASPRP